MAKVAKYDGAGRHQGEFELADAVFSTRIHEQAVHEAVLMQLANRRSAHADTKGVGDIPGGSAKPWRQKGTGRARIGSLRSPLRRGGGVTLGPDGNANYVLRLPRKVRRAALRSILTDATRNGRLAVLTDVTYEAPKTKRAVELMASLQAAGTKVLFVLPGRNENFEKSVRNIPRVKALLWSNLNPHDLLNHDRIVVFETAVPKIVEVLK